MTKRCSFRSKVRLGSDRLGPTWSGWWFQKFVISSLFGEIIPFDEHIFQMGGKPPTKVMGLKATPRKIKGKTTWKSTAKWKGKWSKKIHRPMTWGSTCYFSGLLTSSLTYSSFLVDEILYTWRWSGSSHTEASEGLWSLKDYISYIYRYRCLHVCVCVWRRKAMISVRLLQLHTRVSTKGNYID